MGEANYSGKVSIIYIAMTILAQVAETVIPAPSLCEDKCRLIYVLSLSSILSTLRWLPELIIQGADIFWESACLCTYFLWYLTFAHITVLFFFFGFGLRSKAGIIDIKNSLTLLT